MLGTVEYSWLISISDVTLCKLKIYDVFSGSYWQYYKENTIIHTKVGEFPIPDLFILTVTL